MMLPLVTIKPHAYHDSVTLMTLSQQLTARPGVKQAVAVLGTAENKRLLADVGLLTDDAEQAGPDDLVVAVLAEDQATAEAAVAAAEAALSQRRATTSGPEAAPRTLAAAQRQMPDANLALISVPGPFAAREAWAALRAGLDVLLFSDNVAIEDEVALKQFAAEQGLLCMGPDCGTAIIEGVALGFANVVRRGPIGVVAASGTGAQEVTTLVDRWGGGISQVLGTGGRDGQAAVGGLMLVAGIKRLAADATTETIVVVSKPPAPEVVARVGAALAASGKRTIACFLGYDGPAPAGVALATTLYGAAALAVGRPTEPDENWLSEQRAALQPRVQGQGKIRGLFAGGTLRAEAADELRRQGVAERATLVDYGDDEYTRGRPHPMIDPALRLQALEQALTDQETAVILLDVVLGYGAHADPAAGLAPLIKAARQPVLVAVCGSDRDLQNRSQQVAALKAAGAAVADSTLAAARLAATLIG